MIAVDTNVLVYAHRDSSERHGDAVAWLRHLAEGAVPWGIPVFVVGEFLRVVTHRRIFERPSSLDTALAFLEALLESPTARILAPGPRFLPLLARQARHAAVRGNLVFDAQIAAVCAEGGAGRLLTSDRDFHRFPGLEVVPISGGPEGGGPAS